MWGFRLFGEIGIFYFSGMFLQMLQLDAASSQASKLYFIDLTVW